VLTEPERVLSEDAAFRLCMAMSGVLADIQGVYRGPHSGGSVFLAITDDGLALPPPTTPRTVRTISEGILVGLAHPQDAVRIYLDARGWRVDGERNPWRASHPSGAVVFVWFDELNRVSRVQGLATS
ncbi:MAG: hypothetical protein AAF602_03040, partial [Myxococcota bacterium]